MADERGLILVDTKYEFGKKDGKIFLIDEIHTPDSSRYFYKEGYLERQENGEDSTNSEISLHVLIPIFRFREFYGYLPLRFDIFLTC